MSLKLVVYAWYVVEDKTSSLVVLPAWVWERIKECFAFSLMSLDNTLLFFRAEMMELVWLKVEERSGAYETQWTCSEKTGEYQYFSRTHFLREKYDGRYKWLIYPVHIHAISLWLVLICICIIYFTSIYKFKTSNVRLIKSGTKLVLLLSSLAVLLPGCGPVGED